MVASFGRSFQKCVYAIVIQSFPASQVGQTLHQWYLALRDEAAFFLGSKLF